MDLWKVLAALTSMLLWFGVCLMLLRTEKAVKRAEDKLDELSR